MDSSIAPTESDTRTDQIELPVDIDDLAIDGVQPEVGDQVDLKVGGKITRLVNGVAWVQPETVNGQPMPTTPMERNDGMDEMDRLYNMSQQTSPSAAMPSAY